MESMLHKRQHDILIALIREFISSVEPVSSATLTNKYEIQASPATIRSEMVKLEEEGYLLQIHTSSGRIPTDKAYRYYVNFLLQRQISPPDDIREILQEYEQFEAHIHQLLEHTGKLLADMTHYTSLILAPRLRRTTFKYLKLAQMEENQILIILMTNTGAIINRLIQVEQALSPENLERMTNILNERLSGMFLGDIHLEFLKNLPRDVNDEILTHLSLLTRETVQNEDGQVIYEGAAHLLDMPEFQNLEKLKMIMEMLDEERLVAEILQETLSIEGIHVFIGHEHPVNSMRECSLITATYQIADVTVGTIGIMGPTRMPYHRVIPVVSAFAQVFTKKLARIANL